MSSNLIFWSLVAALILIGSAWRTRRQAVRAARAAKAAVPAPTTSRPVVEAVAAADPGTRILAAILAPAAPRASAPETDQATVSETVSVVLRRQIPPRFDQPSRSWIGGLPQMPDEIEWPRSISSEYPERGERPLHFLAQVCCSDLPRELWGGLGPRNGWLLVFIDTNQGVPEGPDAFKVLHIDALGPEREPPFDLGPVHDGVYTGFPYDYLLPNDVPNTWRRWPVDLVTIPNRVIEGAPTPSIIPQNFASILYDGAPVKDEGRVEPPGKVPFSWRGALYVVDSIARWLAHKHELRLDDVREKLSAPGWIADAINRTDAEIAKSLAGPALQPVAEDASSETKAWVEKFRPEVLKRIEKLKAARQLLAESADVPALLARIEQTHRDYAAWRDGAKQRIAALRERIMAHDLDTPIAAADWGALRTVLDGDRQPYWMPLYKGDGVVLPELIDQSLLDCARDGLRAAQVWLAADYYVSRDLRHLVPDELVAFMEPRWRALHSNRPHRMGGYHDGVQSEAVIGPAKDLLLFQITCDDAMQWSCGDCGAYYFWIRPKHLEARDFSGVRMDLEC